MSDLPASRPARPGIPRNAEPTPKKQNLVRIPRRAKDTPDADCLPARRSSTEVTIAMAQLSSILGGKPGRPGDMLKGIPPRLPRPPKAPEPPKPPKMPKPVGQKKTDSRGDKANEDQDQDQQGGYDQG